MARVVLLLVLAMFTAFLIIGIGSAGTGLAVKIVFMALIAGCVVLASSS